MITATQLRGPTRCGAGTTFHGIRTGISSTPRATTTQSTVYATYCGRLTVPGPSIVAAMATNQPSPSTQHAPRSTIATPPFSCPTSSETCIGPCALPGSSWVVVRCAQCVLGPLRYCEVTRTLHTAWDTAVSRRLCGLPEETGSEEDKNGSTSVMMFIGGRVPGLRWICAQSWTGRVASAVRQYVQQAGLQSCAEAWGGLVLANDLSGV